MQIPDYLKPVLDTIVATRLYSVEEYAAFKGVKPAAVHRAIWRKQGGPQFFKYSGRLRTTGAEIIRVTIEHATKPRQRRAQTRTDAGQFARAEAA